ncbi:hypothetical protein ADK64_37155 [Streptomyces sp. MMG1121]|nr:hypothetical protein ADK64_37155 [Streptomyces sp. MMG1121]
MLAIVHRAVEVLPEVQGSHLADPRWRDRFVAWHVFRDVIKGLAEVARASRRGLPQMALGWVVMRPADAAVQVGAASAGT